MGELTVALGGVRSGKSQFAEELARQANRATMYVATGQASDAAMTERIRRHRERRPPGWATLEAPLRLPDAIEMALSLPDAPETVLIDSIDGWVSNLLLAHEKDDPAATETLVLDAASHLAALAQHFPAHFVMVSSEVGLTLVPPYPLGRQFQDLLGLVNQRLAAAAQRVYLVVAGVPVTIKAFN